MNGNLRFFVLFFVILQLKAEGTGKVGGKVFDASTGEPLPWANVIVSGTTLGAATDNTGFFLIEEVPQGSHRIEFSIIGYRTVVKDVQIMEGAATSINVSLSQEAIGMTAVSVTPGHYGISRSSDDPDQFLDVDEIKTTPGTSGDVYMALATLPGVASVGPAAPVYVQGGRSDENLVLFDHGWVANAFHMDLGGGGVYSIFTPPLLSGVNLYTAGFDAEYGDRLSGVLDVETRDGNCYRYHGSASLSMTGAELVAEGPIPSTDNRVSFLVSARRSYFDLMIGLTEYGDDFVRFPNYYDLTGKLSYKISPRHKLTLTGLWASDNAILVLDTTVTDVRGDQEWNSVKGVTSMMLRSHLGDHLTSRLVASASRGRTEYLLGNEWFDDRTKTVYAVREDLFYSGIKGHFFKAGAILDWRSQEVDMMMPILSHPQENLHTDMPAVKIDTLLAGPCIGAYLTDTWELVPWLSIAPGVRIDYFLPTKEITVSPRFAAALMIGEKLVLRGAWGLYHQTPPLLELTPGYGNPELASRRAQHVVAGAETALPLDITLRTEGFYKVFDQLPLDDSLHGLSNNGEGYAYGAGILIQRQTRSRLRGWTSYTYTVAQRKEYSYIELVAPDFDMTHLVTLVATFDIGRGWEAGARWQYASGRPYTPIVDATRDTLTGYWIPIPGAVNSERTPDFHELDLRMLKRWEFQRWNLAIFLEALNAYSHYNVADFHYNADYTVVDTFPFYPTVIPSFGVIAGF